MAVESKKAQIRFIVIAVVVLTVFVYLISNLHNDKVLNKGAVKSVPTAANLDNAPRSGRPAPSFELERSDGKKVALEDYKGNVLLVHFWATWCPPCLEEIPNIVKFANSFKGKNLKMLAISLDENWERAFTQFPKSLESENIESLIDPEANSSNAYGSYQFPETYLVDKDLNIVTKWIGPQEWTKDFFKEMVEKRL